MARAPRKGGFVALVMAFGLAAPVSWADALPSVLVLESLDPEGQSAFFDALRIQLVGRATVERGPAPVGRRTVERLAEARARMVERGSQVAVWVDLAADSTGLEAVLYALERGRPQAVVEVAELEAAGLERPRVLAIKVAELLEAPLGRKPEAAPVVRATLAPPPPAPPSWAPLAEVGADVAPLEDAASRAGVRVGAGVAFARGRGELVVAAGLRPDRDLALASARAAFAEQDAALALRFLPARGSTLALALALEAGVARAVLDAGAADGRRRTSTFVAPEGRGALDLRVRFRFGASLRLAIGLAARPVRTVTLDGAPLAELGGLRPFALVGFLVGGALP